MVFISSSLKEQSHSTRILALALRVLVWWTLSEDWIYTGDDVTLSHVTWHFKADTASYWYLQEATTWPHHKCHKLLPSAHQKGHNITTSQTYVNYHIINPLYMAICPKHSGHLANVCRMHLEHKHILDETGGLSGKLLGFCFLILNLLFEGFPSAV